MTAAAQNIAQGPLHPLRAQHRRPCISSSQCRPLEPQAAHAKFLAATSTPTSGATSRHRPICMTPIGGCKTLLHSATRPPLCWIQWPAPRLVTVTRRISQSALASPPSSFAHDESFSSTGSCSIPTMASAAMVRRTRSLYQAPTKAAPFPASYMMSILMHGLQDTTSSHHVRVCACLTAQFAFFSRADSGINLLAEDVDIFNDTFSINVKAKNIERSHASPLSRVTSATHDPQRLFQQLQIKWKRLRGHNINKSPYKTNMRHLLKLSRLGFVKSCLPSTYILLRASPILGTLCVTAALQQPIAAHAINVSTPRIIAWGLRRDFNTAITYIDVNVQQDGAAYIFFSNLLAQGWLFF